MLRNHDRRYKALYVKRWVTKRYNDGLARANIKNNFISCNYRLHVTQVVQIKTREMRKDLERAGNMLKKIKNPLAKHTPSHWRFDDEGKMLKEDVKEAKQQYRASEAGQDMKWYEYAKQDKKTGSISKKSFLPNVPKINLPKINLPQISFGGPKPKYFKRRNMMAKNQITRK